MYILIGLDGGGSGCRAQAELPDGRRTALVTGGASNVFSDPDGAVIRIADVLQRVVRQARAMLPDESAQDPGPAAITVLGLAGASESGAAARLGAALPGYDLTICGDIDVSLAGAFADADGIVMAVGTGSVLASQRDGRMQRLGGYGFMLGDQGSGAWIGRAALQAALQMRDGLVPDAPLPREILTRFPDLPALLDFAATARPSDYAAFAPRVLHHDRAACPVAGRILDEGCAYLKRAITHLQGGDATLPVAALGGLGPALLSRIIAQGGIALHSVAPKGTALDGALWLARRKARSIQEIA
ncbi:MAG: BadF/BadG/BcrA/BcrD ATPase family protein [Roseinatronobacter sp.]